MENLELISNQLEKSDKRPILFVHGMWHGAWIWEPYFLPYFKKLGYRAFALSLSNHGNSAKRKNFNLLRINDYVEDVRTAVNTFEGTPIIVGHSMGGYVVQKFLENNDQVAGAILLASVPPFGLWNTTIKTLKSFPLAFFKANTTLNLKHIIDSEEKYRHVLGSKNLKKADIENYLGKVSTESFLAFMDMLGLNPINTHKINVPLYVIGADADNSLSVDNLKKTANVYNVGYKIFEEMGHLIMLEPKYQIVADEIDKWITNVGK